MYRANYPATIAEVLDPQRKFKPEVLAALREFRASKPWQGTIQERSARFRSLHARLCEVYRLATALEFHPSVAHETASGTSCYIPAHDLIVLRGKLSVVTYLHELAHARGMDERGAVAWSVNLFRRVFPRSFERCDQRGHLLVKRSGDKPRVSRVKPGTRSRGRVEQTAVVPTAALVPPTPSMPEPVAAEIPPEVESPPPAAPAPAARAPRRRRTVSPATVVDRATHDTPGNRSTRPARRGRGHSR